MENHYFNLPYDLSGSMAKNRFRNEMLWGLEKMFELYRSENDFVMVFDYVCDVEAHVKGKIECYQLKTNNGATPYTINKIGKPDKTGNSIIGKLYRIRCADGEDGVVSKLALVSNVPLRTLDNKLHSSEAEISFKDLDQKTVKKIEDYLISECDVDNVDLKECYYLYTSMDLFNPHDSLLGKTVNFFVDIYGEEPKRVKVLFQTLVHTIEIKADYEQKCNSYKELVEKKGFTRSEFEQIIKKAIDISDDSIESIRNEVNLMYTEFSLRTKINISVVSMMKELRANKLIKRLEKKLTDYVLKNLEEFDKEMVDAIKVLETMYKDEFPVEYTKYDRQALYIILLVKIREGYYA